MATQDHPRYADWLAATNKLIAAKERLRDAQACKDKAVPAYQRDVDEAQAALDKINKEIDDAENGDTKKPGA